MATNYKYPVLYLLSAFIGGILCNGILSLPAAAFLAALSAALLSLPFHRAGPVSDLLFLFCMFWLGLDMARTERPDYQKDAVYPVSACCEERLSGKSCIVSTWGHRFYLSRFHLDSASLPGDSLHFYASIREMRGRGNPGEFDYSLFLRRKGVCLEFIPQTGICRSGKSKDLLHAFSRLQDRLLAKTGRLTDDTLCRQLIDALCLGHKQEMDPDFRQMFISTGTMHLLSVSGLHTGAIFLLLEFIFRHLGIRRADLASLPFLWAFAALTGLSPSVLRAATILTFITAGRQMARSYTPLNALAASALIALAADTDTLHSLSFLLSYAAYGGIILLFPLFRPYIQAVRKPFRPLLNSGAISISAQLPTLPVSAFYFHTANISGVAANIIAIPIATAILYSATCCIILPEAVGRHLIVIPEILCRIFTAILGWMSRYSLNLTDLYPDGLTIFLLYAVLIFMGSWLFHRKAAMLFICGILLIGAGIRLATENNRLGRRQEIVIFHRRDTSSILLNHMGWAYDLFPPGHASGPDLPYLRLNRLRLHPPATRLGNGRLTWNGTVLTFRQDTLRIAAPGLSFRQDADILVLTGNVRPGRLFPEPAGSRLPRLVIADGSNSFYRVREWRGFCREHGIPFLSTGDEGAVILPLEQEFTKPLHPPDYIY